MFCVGSEFEFFGWLKTSLKITISVESFYCQRDRVHFPEGGGGGGGDTPLKMCRCTGYDLQGLEGIQVHYLACSIGCLFGLEAFKECQGWQ